MKCAKEDPANVNINGPIISLLVTCLPKPTVLSEPDQDIFRLLVKLDEDQIISKQVYEFWFTDAISPIETLTLYLVANSAEPDLLVFIALFTPLKSSQPISVSNIDLTSTWLFQLLSHLSCCTEITQEKIFSALLEVDAVVPDIFSVAFHEKMLHCLQLTEFGQSINDLSIRFMFAYKNILNNLTDDDKQILLAFVFNDQIDAICRAKRYVAFESIVSDLFSNEHEEMILGWNNNPEIVKLFTNFFFGVSSIFSKLIEKDQERLNVFLSKCSNIDTFINYVRTYYANSVLFSKIMSKIPEKLSFVQLVIKLNGNEPCLSTVDDYLKVESKYNDQDFPLKLSDESNVDNLAEKFLNGHLIHLKPFFLSKLDLVSIKSTILWKVILKDDQVLTANRSSLNKTLSQIDNLFPNPFDICNENWAVAMVPHYVDQYFDRDLSVVWGNFSKAPLFPLVNFNHLIEQTSSLKNLELIFKDKAMFPDQDKQKQMISGLLANKHMQKNANSVGFSVLCGKILQSKFACTDEDFGKLFNFSQICAPSSDPEKSGTSNNGIAGIAKFHTFRSQFKFSIYGKFSI